MNFNNQNNRQTLNEEMKDRDFKKLILKEASMAMIAHLLLDNRQKTVMKKIFKIMDESGDGQLEAAELKKGFQEVFRGCNDKDDKGRLLGGVWSEKDLN